jgi:undecaprenyl-diphosphatase
VPIIHAISLGLTQGLSEFLPISSSGHLLLVPWLFGWDDFAGRPELEKSFDVALHIGTLVGAIAYFRHDIWRLIREGLQALDRRRETTLYGRLAWLIVLSTIPAAVTGALFQSFIDRELGRIWLIGIMLIVFGLVLLWADRLGGTKKLDELDARQAFGMGLGQAFALQPGISRSGVTITVGRGLGFERDATARISFLMSIPVIAGAVLYKGLDVMANGGIPEDMVGGFFWGIVASAITGWFAVWGTLRLVRTHSFFPFVVYRIGAGVTVLLLLVSTFR